MRGLLSVLVALPLVAQTQPVVTFAPQPAKIKAATIWGVVACAGPVPLNVPAGQVYRLMLAHDISYLVYASALEALHAKVSQSAPARMAKYLGWAATGASFLLTTGPVKANAQWASAVTIGGGLFSVLLPLAQKEIPPPLEYERLLLRDSDVLTAAPGACVSGVVLGAAGKPFTVAGGG